MTTVVTPQRQANPIISDADIYYAQRRTMTNPKGWRHVHRVLERALTAGAFPHATDDQIADARAWVTRLADADDQ